MSWSTSCREAEQPGQPQSLNPKIEALLHFKELGAEVLSISRLRWGRAKPSRDLAEALLACLMLWQPKRASWATNAVGQESV